MEVKEVAMNLITSALGSNGDLRAAVAPELRCGVMRNDPVLRYIIRIEAKQVRLRVRIGILVGFDAINGHIVGAISSAKCMSARTGCSATRGSLD